MAIDNRARLRLAAPLSSIVAVIAILLLCTHGVDAALDDEILNSGLQQLWDAAGTHEERALVTSIYKILTGDLGSVNSRQTVVQILSLPFGGGYLSVLHWAASTGANDALSVLVRGIPGTVNCLLIPDDDAHSRWKQLLQCAISNGYGGAVGILLVTAPVEFFIDANDPTLLLAAQYGNEDVARELFGTRGRPIRVRDGETIPALRVAAASGNLACVSELLGNIDISNSELEDARGIAEQNGQLDVVKKLADEQELGAGLQLAPTRAGRRKARRCDR